MKPPILRPAAAADVEGAYRWYEEQRAGLGGEFLVAVQAGLELIAAHPLAAPVVPGELQGPAGSVRVLTVWIQEPERAAPRLVTVQPR